ncbi:hypothetical protein RND81_11G078400 [Saponaria officinalis]|uniref:PWWP domain-containing protein n=1 Tax=Saponaria officinalis TaxID=3572 RepID=A0AAW1HJ52_SAPOF
MPPPRKKGANDDNILSSSSSSFSNGGVNSVADLNLGDLVLAKVKGFPAWPAKVSSPEDWERTPDPKKYFVQFFGTQEIAFVAPVDIQAFTGEAKRKLLARCKGKTVKYFAQAVKAICDAFEELEKYRNIRGVVKHDTFRINDGKIEGSHVKLSKILKSGELCQSNYILDRAPLVCDSALVDNQTAAMNDSTALREDKLKTRKADSVFLGHAQALITGMSLAYPGEERKVLGENETFPAFRECIKSPTATSSSAYCDSSNVERDSSRQGSGTKDISMSPGASGHLRYSAGEDKMLAIVDKSKGTKAGTKRKVHGVVCHSDDAKSGGYIGDGVLKKVSAGGDVKRLASDLDRDLNTQGNTLKNLFRSPKLSHAVKTSPKKLVTNAGEYVDGRYARQENGHPNREQSLSLKKSEYVDRIHDDDKGSVLKNGKSNLEADMLDEEAVPLVAKRHHHALDAVSHDDKRNLGIKYLEKDVKKKRKAVRLCDDGDDKPKTPVHEGSMKYAVEVSTSALISDSVKRTNENNISFNHAVQNSKGVSRDEGGLLKDHPSVKPAGKSSLGATLPLKAGSSFRANVSHILGSEALDKRAVNESKTDLISLTRSPQVVAAVKKSGDQQKSNKPSGMATDSVSQSKAYFVSGKDSVMSCASTFTQSQVSAQKITQPISGQKAKFPPKIGVKVTEQAASLDMLKDRDFEVNGRSEDIRGKSGSLVDSNLKNLIAAAQGKMRPSHMQNVPHVGGDSGTGPSAILLGRSSSPSLTSQSFKSYGGNVTQCEAQGDKSLGSDESEEKGPMIGHHSAGRALSGGTEAAVARDAFEGMIETLSRTKESIGRATRLAIDCTKYGMANEVSPSNLHITIYYPWPQKNEED